MADDTPVTASALILSKIEDMAGDLKDIKHAINGNGTPGIKVRLDRLEQAAESRRWQFKALFGGVLTLIGKWIYETLHK